MLDIILQQYADQYQIGLSAPINFILSSYGNHNAGTSSSRNISYVLKQCQTLVGPHAVGRESSNNIEG
jgi:hypothetical protein